MRLKVGDIVRYKNRTKLYKITNLNNMLNVSIETLGGRFFNVVNPKYLVKLPNTQKTLLTLMEQDDFEKRTRKCKQYFKGLDYQLVYYPDKLMVGCQEVPKESVKDIIDTLTKVYEL